MAFGVVQEHEDSISRQNKQQASGSDSDSTEQQECSVSPSTSHTGLTTAGEGLAEPATEVQVLEDHVSQSNSTDSDASSDKIGDAQVPPTAQTTAADVTGEYYDEVASASTAGEAVPTAGVPTSTAVDSSSTSEVASMDEACTASVDMDLQDRGHLPAVVCRVSGGEHAREANSMQSSPIYGVATTSSQAFTPTQRTRLAQNAKQGVHHLEIESSPQLYFGCMAWYISWLLASWPPPPRPAPSTPSSPTSLLRPHHLCLPEGKLWCQTSGSSCTIFACAMLSL